MVISNQRFCRGAQKNLKVSILMNGLRQSTKNKPSFFVLDELEDPHNVGAGWFLMAAASGAAGVILSKHRQSSNKRYSI